MKRSPASVSTFQKVCPMVGKKWMERWFGEGRRTGIGDHRGNGGLIGASGRAILRIAYRFRRSRCYFTRLHYPECRYGRPMGGTGMSWIRLVPNISRWPIRVAVSMAKTM